MSDEKKGKKETDIVGIGTEVIQNPEVQSGLKVAGLWLWGKISGWFSSSKSKK